MNTKNFVIDKLQGYSGIRLKENKPLVFKPGINLLVGRNGSGKSNLINLIHCITTDHGDLRTRIESSFFVESLKSRSRNKNSSIEKSFGEVTIAQYSLKEQSGAIKLLLKSTPEEYVVNNLLQPGQNFQGHITVVTEKIPIKFNWINSNQSSIKFEMNGYISTNILSRDHDNKAHKIMEGPIKTVSDFVRQNINDFYRSEAFISKMDDLEKSINSRFTKFFGNTKKRAKINYHDIHKSGHISLSLMDGENYIESSYISTGETVLLNLIFSLTTAIEDRCDILCMDEPDIHMHDDMIQVLVDELSDLSRLVPEMIIVVASHSTAMIERLAALDKNRINVITFDHNRNVSNDSKDIDLINALSNNGVKFSPLMLSRRTNIFIENQLVGGKIHRDFFLKFFLDDNIPNIIPIGTSGNVQDKKSFTSIFEEILNVSNIRSIGIQDGDIWFKDHLVAYITGKLSLSSLISLLEGNNEVYIPIVTSKNVYYFRFWEIENLYLMPEVINCWTDTDGAKLDVSRYKLILLSRKREICREYLKTFYKAIVRIRVDKEMSVLDLRKYLNEKFSAIESYVTDEVPTKVELLIDAIIDENMLHWIPGKEVKSILEQEGFHFNNGALDFENSNLSKSIRSILN